MSSIAPILRKVAYERLGRFFRSALERRVETLILRESDLHPFLRRRPDLPITDLWNRVQQIAREVAAETYVADQMDGTKYRVIHWAFRDKITKISIVVLNHRIAKGGAKEVWSVDRLDLYNGCIRRGPVFEERVLQLIIPRAEPEFYRGCRVNERMWEICGPRGCVVPPPYEVYIQEKCLEAFQVYGGPDLRSVAFQMSIEEKIVFMQQIWKALSILHKEGRVHGDVKGMNVLVGPDQIRLIDFDFASRQTVSVGEDSQYQYWNLARLSGYITLITDAYGFAVTLFEVFFPHHRNSIVMRSRFLQPRDCSSFLLEVCQDEALRKSVSQRRKKAICRATSVDEILQMVQGTPLYADLWLLQEIFTLYCQCLKDDVDSFESLKDRFPFIREEPRARYELAQSYFAAVKAMLPNSPLVKMGSWLRAIIQTYEQLLGSGAVHEGQLASPPTYS
jgi:serine/threonine protein kinase